MFALTITYGPKATQDSLFYKTSESAGVARDTLFTLTSSTLADDFGSEFFLPEGVEIHSIRLSDIDKSLDASVEQSLSQMRAQAKSQQRASSDPLMQIVRNGGRGFGQVI